MKQMVRCQNCGDIFVKELGFKTVICDDCYWMFFRKKRGESHL